MSTRALAEAKSIFQAAMKEMSRKIVGQEEVLKQVLSAILCNGHVLLEGNPGIGKTMMVKSVADVLDLKFSRIQNTPDLMPSDITGTHIIEERKAQKEFIFHHGPIFANVVLADEINRATPKTQAAYLESMQERQVTAGNETFPLPEPFFVLATQNPIDLEGSLTPDQHVFINDELKTGEELIKYAMDNNATYIEEQGKKLIDLQDSYTYSLNMHGNIEKARCFLYVLPYDDEIILFKTQTGRKIRVTKNHPFLVSENGIIKWKKAEDITQGDFLVSPALLPETDIKLEKISHFDAIRRLKEKFSVVTYEDIIELKEKSGGFKDFSSFDGKDFNKLRIASNIDKKTLSKKLGLNKKEYWQLVRFLRRNTNNSKIKRIISEFFSLNPPKIGMPADYIESYRITRLCRLDVDEGIISWLAFLLSDGTIAENCVAAYQKNYPKALDDFICISKKMGLKVDIKKDHDGRAVVIRSKPLVEYLKLRFDIENPSWFISLPKNLRIVFLRTFISLESNLDCKRKRILFSQKDKKMTNIILYMLLKEGILSWVRYEKNGKGIYRVKIQGRDFPKYLKHIGWIDPSKINKISDSEIKSPFRLIPINKTMLMKLCKLLGITSFHTFEKRKKMTMRKWYPAYRKIKEGREYMSEYSFNLMIEDLKNEIEIRKSMLDGTITEQNPRELAVLCGLPMTEISDNTNFTKHAVWQLYTGQQQKSELVNYVQQQFVERLSEAETILTYLEKLSNDFIFYEKIRSMKYKRYSGHVFGLTVPDKKNYIAGFGACGINHNTFPLPEAQTDRFMFKVLVGYPTLEEESKIVDRFASERNPNISLRKIINKNKLLELQSIVRVVPISEQNKNAAIKIVEKTRNSKFIEFGASPRASLYLVLAAKARALVEGKSYVSREHINAMAYPVLRHRIILSFEAEKGGKTPDDVVSDLMKA